MPRFTAKRCWKIAKQIVQEHEHDLAFHAIATPCPDCTTHEVPKLNKRRKLVRGCKTCCKTGKIMELVTRCNVCEGSGIQTVGSATFKNDKTIVKPTIEIPCKNCNGEKYITEAKYYRTAIRKYMWCNDDEHSEENDIYPEDAKEVFGEYCSLCAYCGMVTSFLAYAKKHETLSEKIDKCYF